MAATTNVSFTGNADIDGVLGDTKWASNAITYSFPTSIGFYGYSELGFQAMNADQIAAARSIFAQFSSFANLQFTQLTETSTTHATIRLAEEDNAGTAYAYLPTPLEQGGDVWLNHTDYNLPSRGTYAYFTMMHEIGHALGLDHGHDGAAVLPYSHDSIEYSIMTYRSYVGASTAFLTPREGSFPLTPMLSDIAALQYLYGANYNHNSSDSRYSWGPDSGEIRINGIIQGQSTTNTILQTIWDGGGNDTYDLSNFSGGVKVSLVPGVFSTLSQTQLARLDTNVLATGNIANALLFGGNTGSLIENAIGGSGNDELVGNVARNFLQGGGGHDLILGGDDNDTIWGNDPAATGAFVDGRDQIYGQNGDDLIYGNQNDDFLVGGAGADIIIAGRDNDTVWGNDPGATGAFSDGADQIYGQEGDDVIYGNQNNDFLAGGAGADLILGGRDNDTIWGNDPSAVGAYSDGADQIYGQEGDDIIYGNQNNDFLSGGAGADVILGGRDNDTIWGNDPNAMGAYPDGADQLFGQEGDDLIYGNQNNDLLAGEAGADILVGGLDNDTLWGDVVGTATVGDGADQLYGQGGVDVLTGGGGNDVLWGGTESDTFVFGDAWGVDTIFDWENGLDLLDFSAVTNLALTFFTDTDHSVVSSGSSSIIFQGFVGTFDTSGWLLA